MNCSGVPFRNFDAYALQREHVNRPIEFQQDAVILLRIRALKMRDLHSRESLAHADSEFQIFEEDRAKLIRAQGSSILLRSLNSNSLRSSNYMSVCVFGSGSGLAERGSESGARRFLSFGILIVQTRLGYSRLHWPLVRLQRRRVQTKYSIILEFLLYLFFLPSRTVYSVRCVLSAG